MTTSSVRLRNAIVLVAFAGACVAGDLGDPQDGSMGNAVMGSDDSTVGSGAPGAEGNVADTDASRADGGSGGSGGSATETGGDASAGSGRDAGLGGAIGSDGGAPGRSAGASGESSAACAIATLPAYSALTANTRLPDPFKTMAGARITGKDQWPCRRAEIAAQVQQYELGPKPPKPASVTGSFSGNALTVDVTEAGKSISFRATISKPSTGSAPFPAMIGIGAASIGNLSRLGVASITFDNNDMAQQNGPSSRGKGKFYTLYGSDHAAGAMTAWAWGVSRLIDALESTPDAGIDTKRLGVTGCSRNGKGALVAGALDERIVLTIPQESGSGGAAAWRVSDAQKSAGQNVQTLSQITGENCWFTSTFSQFGASASRLPFDHHMVMSLVAPRALLVIENTSMEWLGNLSCYTSSMAAHMTWEALGIPDKMGFSQVGHPDHCGFPASQQPELSAFVQKFLVGGGTADTNVLKTDASFMFDRTKWVDWTVPALE